MEYAFSFITLGFGGMLLLYAGLLRLTLDVRLIPRSSFVNMKDAKAYARTFADLTALLALAFLTGGWVGLYTGPALGAIALAVSLAAAIWLCVRLWRHNDNKNQ